MAQAREDANLGALRCSSELMQDVDENVAMTSRGLLCFPRCWALYCDTGAPRKAPHIWLDSERDRIPGFGDCSAQVYGRTLIPSSETITGRERALHTL